MNTITCDLTAVLEYSGCHSRVGPSFCITCKYLFRSMYVPYVLYTRIHKKNKDTINHSSFPYTALISLRLDGAVCQITDFFKLFLICYDVSKEECVENDVLYFLFRNLIPIKYLYYLKLLGTNQSLKCNATNLIIK